MGYVDKIVTPLEEPPVSTGIDVDTCLEKGLKGAGEEVGGHLLRLKLSGSSEGGQRGQ